MAARLLLGLAGLLAAAAGLGAPAPGAPWAGRAREEPLPGHALPAGPGPGRAAPATRPPGPGPERAHSIDPWDTWMLFVRQSDKGVNGKRGSRGKAKKLKLGLPGPPGPPGPQGPPGPITPPEALLKELRLLLKGAVQPREEPCTRGPAAAPATTPDAEEAVSGAAGALALLAAPLAPGPWVPRVEAAFHCRLRRDASVERRALHELGAYYLPDAEGAFRRGPGLNLTSGQYTAPVAGFYALAATLHVALAEQPRRAPLRPRDRLRLLICIQSRCQRNAPPLPCDLIVTHTTMSVFPKHQPMEGQADPCPPPSGVSSTTADPGAGSSLEAVTGLESSSELFTISVNGVLYLQTGQHTSVFLDNASGSPLTVRSGSHFSAVLLGV